MISVSTNSTDWQVVTNAGRRSLWDGAYGLGRFVLVGDLGDVWVSTHGYNWLSNNVRPYWTLNEVEFVGDQFVAAGIGGVVFSSKDGLTWEEHLMPGPPQIFALAFGHDRLVVGGAGMLFLSDPLHEPTRTIRGVDVNGNRKMKMTLLGLPGALWGLEASRDLKVWEPLDTLFAPLGRVTYEIESSEAERFFKANPVEPPCCAPDGQP